MVFTLTLVYASQQVSSGTSYTDSLVTVSTTDILSLRFVKERYTPYTQLSGKAVIEDHMINDVKSIELKCDDTVLHFGAPDTLEWELSNNCCVLSFSSRGYTSALGQNQLTPGLHYDVTFQDLMTSEIALPNISYETTSTKLNYIYIKENDSMWDAATAFARKYCKGYPFIWGANTVRMSTISTNAYDISSDDIISASAGQDYSHTISHFHMKNLEGNYNTYSLVNDDAVERDIIRHKHISFDRQWLSDQNEAMRYRFDFSQRGHRYIKLRYHGYNHEDIKELVTFSTTKIIARRQEISKLELNVSQRGAVTTLWFYDDNYTYWV